MAVAERFSNVHSNAHLNQSQMIALLSLPDAEAAERFQKKKNPHKSGICGDFSFPFGTFHINVDSVRINDSVGIHNDSNFWIFLN